jgi:hypothetical protein
MTDSMLQYAQNVDIYLLTYDDSSDDPLALSFSGILIQKVVRTTGRKSPHPASTAKQSSTSPASARAWNFYQSKMDFKVQTFNVFGTRFDESSLCLHYAGHTARIAHSFSTCTLMIAQS